MRYLFRFVYTPDDTSADRRRHSVIVESDTGVLDALDLALVSLDMKHLKDDFVKELLEQSADEDTSEGFNWVVCLNSGEWDVEFEQSVNSHQRQQDPVTKESLLAWVKKSRADQSADGIHRAHQTSTDDCWSLGRDASPHQLLVEIMGRWNWRQMDGMSSHDLKESLHEITVGYGQQPFKGYIQMTIDELMDLVMGEPVVYCANLYKDLAYSDDEPFGITTMIESDKELWLGDD